MIGNPQPFISPAVDWWALTPQLVLLGVALTLLLVSSLARRPLPAGITTGSSLVATSAAAVVSWDLWNSVRTDGPRSTLANAFVVDTFSVFFTILTCAALAVTLLVAHGYARRNALALPELNALALVSAVGAIVMASANDLIVLFLGLETLSIALYILIALHVRRANSREGAAKYFVLGAVSSAFLLYGIALIYGATGSTNFTDIAGYLRAFVLRDEHLLMAGIALAIVGLGFKVAAVPFHLWAPDVYQGAPSPITGYLASVAKAAGFAALARLLYGALATHQLSWTPLLTGLAYATVAAGSILAICQTDVKRLLAYSSIAHAGYVLVGLQSGTGGIESALAYLLVYTFMVIGSFAVVAVVTPTARAAEEAGEGAGGGMKRPAVASASSSGTAPDAAQAGTLVADAPPTGGGWEPAVEPDVPPEGNDHHLSRYAGLARNHPVLALSFTVLLFAQAGVPLTTGFIAKFGVISAAVTNRTYLLAVVAMVAAVIAAFAYLRVVLAMYAPPDDSTHATATVTRAGTAAVAICVAVSVIFGILPEPVLRFAADAAQTLIG